MNKNSPLAKGVRTAYQVVPAFFLGLVITVWAVPGVPEAVKQYIFSNAWQLVASLGLTTSVFAGLLSFGQNKAEDK